MRDLEVCVLNTRPDHPPCPRPRSSPHLGNHSLLVRIQRSPEISKSRNNAAVCSSLGVAYEPSEKDLLDMFSRLTGVSVVDKKGILSSSNPCIDKVSLFSENWSKWLFR